MASGESASYNKLVSAAAKTEGVSNAEYKQMLEAGKKTMSVVNIETSGSDKRDLVHGLAMDAIDEWETRKNQEALQRKAEKKGMTVEEYQEDIANSSKAQKVLNKLGGIAKGLFCAIPNTIKRSKMLGDYKDTIEESIRKNDGNLAAASIAAEEMLKQQQDNNDKKIDKEAVVKKTEERLGDGEGDDFINALIGRAEEAVDAGEDNEDTGVKLNKLDESSFAETRNKKDEELTIEEKKRKAIAGFTEEVARADKGEGDESVFKAKEQLLDTLSELGDNKQSNYGKLADDIIDNFKGALNKELNSSEESKKHQEALAAIDKYLDQTVSINEATVSTGLAAKEVYTKLGDKSILNNGVIIGTTVSLGAAAAVAFSRSAVVQAVGGSPIARVAIAVVIGGVRGYKMEGRRQQRENIKRAVSMNESEDGYIEAGENKNENKNQFSILGAEKAANDMQALIGEDSKLISKNQDGSPIDEEGLKKVYDRALRMIANVKRRNELQNEKRIQLIGYKGRESIEQEKLEMFKAMTALKRAMRETYPDKTKEDLDNEIAEMMDKAAINDEIKEVKRTQRNERLGAAGKGALYAGATALAFTGAINLIPEGIVGDKIAGLSSDGSETETPQPIGEAAPVLIEEDPQGGVNIGVDSDGDGKIDANEYLRGDGEGSEEGVDLTDDKVYESVREELAEKYNVDLQREDIEVNGYHETSVGEYMENAENKVDNSGGVDWARSETKYVIGQPSVAVGDGMDKYEVPVWGVNGQEVPDGTTLFIDLDGDGGSEEVLTYNVKGGKVEIPADVVDTSNVGNGGAANFIGTVRLGEMDDNHTIISYATAFGGQADSSTTISAVSGESGYAFTAIDNDTGERLSQFAVDESNKPISNLSEIFNGVQVGDSDRMPATFVVNDIDGEVASTALGSGEEVPDLDYQGGYHPEYDSFENTPFIENTSYLGTPIEWDANGDGVMSPEEEASYFKQMLVRTGTNPNMLGQNASNYGLLEPDRLKSIIPRDKLVEWGITDGVVDSEAELNTLLDNLKEPENADYYDSLVNETINEMETVMQGGSFRVETIHDRLSTYANSDRDIDTARASIARTAIYPVDADGNPVGNKGWWCRKYGVEGGWVADMPDCNQKGVERGKIGGGEGSGGKTGGNEGSGGKTGGSEGSGGKTGGNEGSGGKTGGNEGSGGKGDSGGKEDSGGDEGAKGKGDDTHAGDETDLPVTPEQGDDYVQPTDSNHVDPSTQPGSQVETSPTDNSSFDSLDSGSSSGQDTGSQYSTDTSGWQGSTDSSSNNGSSSSNAASGSAEANVEDRSAEELKDLVNQ